jgi:hypothetical protein
MSSVKKCYSFTSHAIHFIHTIQTRFKLKQNIMQSISDPNTDLDSTIAALQGELVALPPETALGAIDHWQQQLQGTEFANLLGDLKGALTGVNYASIAQILTTLGSQTTASASGVNGPLADKLLILGQLLAQAGISLS